MKQCVQCSGQFEYLTSDGLCLKCSQKTDLDFKRIKNYLEMHPRSTVGVISTELSVSVSVIQKFMDEGRLEIVEKDPSSNSTQLWDGTVIKSTK